MTDEELDGLLSRASIVPPEDFVLRVMRRIHEPRGASETRWRWLARRLALIAGAALAATQVAAFAFSTWTVANAAL
jgi:hypothetical protein